MKSAKDRAIARRARKKKEAARQGLEVRECKVCLTKLPAVFEHEHHEIPQATGGKAGPTSSLCGTCHNNLHVVGQMLMGKKAGLVEDAIRIMYPDAGARQRLMKLAQVVVEYMTLKRDGQLESEEPVRVMIELPPQVKFAAQMIAHDMRGPTGRNLGLATWISGMVKQIVYERYPHLKPKS